METEYPIEIIASHQSKTRVGANISFLSIEKDIPQLNNLSEWFIYTGVKRMRRLTSSFLLWFLKKTTPDLHMDSTVRGLQRLVNLIDAGIPVFHDIYTDKEKEAEPDKAQTKLFYMPAVNGAPFIVICAGGAYRSVYSMIEAFPAAEYINRLGYNAFILSYRIGGKRLLPKPVEDLAAALRCITKNAESFNVSPEKYGVAGFSAGGHLAAAWGTDNNGYIKYNQPKPAVLMLGYAPTDLAVFDKNPKSPVKKMLFKTMLGDNYAEKDIDAWNIVKNISNAYPPTYIWQCADDKTVSTDSSVSMAEKLKELSVPHILRIFERGGHGIGVGEKTDASGWIKEAVAFWQENAG